MTAMTCSAKACAADAAFAMLWNNPRIHSPERRKVWLACPAHRVHLHDYLASRGLLRDDVPVSEIPEGAG